MTGWVCQWKPFWIQLEDSFKKAYLDDWAFICDVASEGPSSTDQGEVIPETPGVSKFAFSLPWEPAKPHDKACFWERIEAPLPPLRPRPKCDFIHPRQLSPFPERLVLPFSTEVILSRYEEIDSSGNDLCTSWTKLSEHEILVEHMVDTEKATADFRETYDGRDTTSSHLKNSKKKTLSDPFDCAKEKGRCLRTTNCKKMANHYLAGIVRVCWPRASHESLPRDPLRRLCNSLQQWHLLPNIDVKSVYFHDTRRDLPAQVIEGENGWVLQGFLSRAIFRRPPVSGLKYFTVLSLQISNIYAKKKCIAKKLSFNLLATMISQEVDLVVGDFNGRAWRCRSRDNLSTIDEAFTDSTLPTPPGLPPLWWPGTIPDNWADVCGFLKPPGSQRSWKVNKHGAFSTPLFADCSHTRSRQNTYDPRITLKERPADGALEIPNDELARSWVTIRSRRTTATTRSMATTRTSSPSDLMTRLSQRVPSMSCCFFRCPIICHIARAQKSVKRGLNWEWFRANQIRTARKRFAEKGRENVEWLMLQHIWRYKEKIFDKDKTKPTDQMMRSILMHANPMWRKQRSTNAKKGTGTWTYCQMKRRRTGVVHTNWDSLIMKWSGSQRWWETTQGAGTVLWAQQKKSAEEHNEGMRHVEEVGLELGKPDEGSDHVRFPIWWWTGWLEGGK